MSFTFMSFCLDSVGQASFVLCIICTLHVASISIIETNTMHVETKCLSIAMIRLYKVIHLFVLACRVGHFLLLSEIDNYHWKFELFFLHRLLQGAVSLLVLLLKGILLR